MKFILLFLLLITNSFSYSEEIGRDEYQFGIAAYEIGEYGKAIELFDRALELGFTEKDKVYMMRALSFYKQESYEQAGVDFSEAIKINGNDYLLYYYRGANDLAQSKNVEAISDLNRSIELNPENAGSYNLLATAYERNGSLNEAINKYSKAISIDPNNPEFYFNRAYAKYGSGNIGDAISDFDRAIALDPDFAGAFANRARLKFQLGDNTGGCLDVGKACELGHCQLFDEHMDSCKKTTPDKSGTRYD